MDDRSRMSAYADLVAALLSLRADPATERFDAELAAAEAAGAVDGSVARTLRWWQRESLRGLADHVASVLPDLLADLAASERAAADAVAASGTSWATATHSSGASVAEPVARGAHSAPPEPATPTPATPYIVPPMPGDVPGQGGSPTDSPTPHLRPVEDVVPGHSDPTGVQPAPPSAVVTGFAPPPTVTGHASSAPTAVDPSSVVAPGADRPAGGTGTSRESDIVVDVRTPAEPSAPKRRLLVAGVSALDTAVDRGTGHPADALQSRSHETGDHLPQPETD